MKTTIVCGLLGTGKTTFIRNYLKHRAEKTVVLVNDFGRTGIDGEIFSAGGIDAVELPSGCVCCTLKFDLITTIQRIRKQFAPEHLMIEPSGVASPSGVLEALTGAGEDPASVVGIVDAVEFTELFESGMYGAFFEEQIKCSDVILVNKVDIAPEPAVRAAEETIASINPHALQFRTTNAEIPLSLSGEQFARRDESRSQKSSLLVTNAAHVHFETLSFAISGKPALADFSAFFEALSGGLYGRVVRAKALVATGDGPYRFDCVYGRVDKERFEKEVGHSRLVIIGEGLERQEMEKLFLTSLRVSTTRCDNIS